MYNTLVTSIFLTIFLFLQYGTGASADYTTMFSAGNGHWEGFEKMNWMFAFGASYTATGFDWKNGVQPGPNNPLGNPDTYKGHTACNGPNFIMYMTTQYNQSFVKTYDFAWPGAPVPGVVGQVSSAFAPLYTGGGRLDPKWEASRTLFPIFVGINDLDHWNPATTFPVNYMKHRDDVFVQYTSAIDVLYSKGARNFVVYNVPPLDRGPDVHAPQKTEIADYNSWLRGMAFALTSKHRDAIIWHVDMNALFTDVFDNKDRFVQTRGFKELNAVCPYYAKNWLKLPSMTYKDPSCAFAVNEYFWLNGRHVTYPLHDLLAEVTHNGLLASH